MFTPFGLALPFQRVFGMGHLAAPTAFHQAELEKVEMKVKMPPTSFQDSFNRPPKSFSNPLMLNLKLELASWEKRGWSL